MSNIKVCLVLIDALRSDYISKENTPFLYKLSKENIYYKEITQSRSFCERAEIFTGLSPEQSGYFTAIGYEPENSPYKNINKYLEKLDYINIFLPKNRLFDIYKSQLNKLLKKKYKGMSAYSIPLKFIKYFSLTEDKFDFRSNKAFDGNGNIFNDCKNHNINIYYDSFTALNFKQYSTDDEKLQTVTENIENEYGLYLVYQGIIDITGHKYGPNSNELKYELNELDKKLEKFYNKIIAKDKDCKFIFLGDHGMSSITDTIDIEKIINKIIKNKNIAKGKDFIYFLDSTIFRIWYFNDKTKEILQKELINNIDLNRSGYFVTKEIAKNEEIPFNDIRYGDDIWLAKIGTLIFPDFFHNSKPYKGMHGYDVNDKSSKGTCIIVNNKNYFHYGAKLTDIYKFIKEELEIL